MILGPINGGLPWPAEYPELRAAEREWLSYVRGAPRVPAYGATRRSPTAILAGSLETLRQIPRRLPRQVRLHAGERHRPERYPDTPGGDQDAASPGPLRRPPRALQGVRHGDHGRGAGAARGAAAADRGRDGPERERLEALVAAEGVGGAVSFAGRVPPQEVRHRYGASDLLLFPSVREFGGGVVLEAMAMGSAPLVVDDGGPGELVTAEAGIKVPLAPRGPWSPS